MRQGEGRRSGREKGQLELPLTYFPLSSLTPLVTVGGNLGLGFCPYQTVYVLCGCEGLGLVAVAGADEWKVGNGDIKGVRNSFVRKEVRLDKDRSERADNAISRDETYTHSYFRTTPPPSLITAIIFIPRPNPFRDSLRSSQESAAPEDSAVPEV